MKLFYLLFFILFSSCGDDTFRKVESLDGFRILGVYSPTPEVAPNTAVTLQLYVSDTKGGGREIIGTTTSCIDPGIALGAKVNCDHDPSALIQSYTIDTRLADLPANLYTGFSGSVNVTVPNSILLGRSGREQFNGVGFITIFNFEVDGKDISVFKRIVATNRGSLNVNPAGSAILLDGSAITYFPNDDSKLSVTTSAPESYNYLNVDGSTEFRSEKYQIAWYVSEGEFDRPKAGIDEIVKYRGDGATGPSLVIAIIRDERGGLDIVRKYFP